MIGRTFSHYRILQKLGAGGMGVVYLARDLALERDVVLKFLPPSLTADKEAAQRLIQEAKAASALDHPNICTIYGLDETGEGQAFISMAYYQGKVLKDRIASGPLALEEAVPIARQIALGLAAAHARGIVHRDIKPGNVIITGGVVKLLDFGVAKLAGGNRITQTGMTVGTAAYISPEQMRGLDVDHRTDIWSLGVVFYEMLTGVRPFRADGTKSLIHAILTTKPKPVARVIPGLPESLDRFLAKTMAKDPAGRQSDMSEVLRDLSAFAPAGPEVSGVAFPRPPARRARRGPVLAAAVVGILLLAGGAAWLWLTPRSSAVKAPVVESREAARGPAAAAVARLAVLPFSNLGKEPGTDYLGYALADRIADRLGYFKGVVVRSSSATREYRDRKIDAAEAGKKLKVDYVLTGGYSSDARAVQLNYELVNVASGARVLREPVEVRSEEAFRLQTLVAARVVRGLGLDASTGDQGGMRTDVPGNPLAYQHYLQSLSYEHGYGGNQLAFPLLKECIALDPGYAPAYAELGSRHEIGAVYALGGAGEIREAEQAFVKALSINRHLLDALSGLARLYTDIGQPDKAIGLLREALEINPSHADSHFALSYIYRYAGMLEESAREGELALTLDPNNTRYRSLATTYLYLGNLDRSLEVHKLDPDSGWALSRIGQIYLRRGQTERALENLERAIAKEPESSSGLWARAMKASLQGRREEGLAVLKKSKEATMVDGEQRYHFANIHCLLGDRDGCLHGLEAAVKGGFFNYPFLMSDSFLDLIRNDRAFQGILALAKAKHEDFKARFFPSLAVRSLPRREPPPSLRSGDYSRRELLRDGGPTSSVSAFARGHQGFFEASGLRAV